MRLAGKSHRKLHETWRHGTNLIGKLAAVITDGEAFPTFLRQEGCASPLARQTVRMAHTAVAGTNMLLHRFRVSGLDVPDHRPLAEAVVRIDRSYNDAMVSHNCSSAAVQQ